MEPWFEDARFGLFVHWSHSSQQGIEVSWPLVGGIANLPGSRDIPVERYHSTAATFDPKAYDPRAWAQMARRLGMTYAVLTAKHHDGFAMWDTKQSDFSVAHSAYGRDLVGPFTAALRAEGLRVGLYFSLCDWRHPDYPAFTDADKPYRFGVSRQPSPEQWARFRAFLFAQVEELLTSFGPIDLLWFDGGWERTPEQWGARALRARIRELAPHALVNDRLPGEGDFDTPEQFVPAQPPARAWETCLTINESWAYNPSDRAWKSPRRLVHTLCEVAGKGGNLLLNVGPKGDGTLPEEILARLDEVERWMARHARAIVGTRPGLSPWQFYGPSTRRENTLYLHCLARPYDVVTVRGMQVRRVRGARALGTGESLRTSARCAVLDQLFHPDPQGELTIEVPERAIDPLATVLEVELADAPLPRAPRG